MVDIISCLSHNLPSSHDQPSSQNQNEMIIIRLISSLIISHSHLPSLEEKINQILSTISSSFHLPSHDKNDHDLISHLFSSLISHLSLFSFQNINDDDELLSNISLISSMVRNDG